MSRTEQRRPTRTQNACVNHEQAKHGHVNHGHVKVSQFTDKMLQCEMPPLTSNGMNMARCGRRKQPNPKKKNELNGEFGKKIATFWGMVIRDFIPHHFPLLVSLSDLSPYQSDDTFLYVSERINAWFVSFGYFYYIIHIRDSFFQSLSASAIFSIFLAFHHISRGLARVPQRRKEKQK